MFIRTSQTVGLFDSGLTLTGARYNNNLQLIQLNIAGQRRAFTVLFFLLSVNWRG